MTIGSRIALLRKGNKMTQESLAQLLGVTNQAVSKWEANQCCPDIQLLPRIADIFEVSIDSLFGREFMGERAKTTTKDELPWEDDETLRAVIYIGHTLVKEQNCSEAKEIEFIYEGPALDVESSFSVNCELVEGDVNAGTDVVCDIVEGDVTADGNVTCDVVDGDVTAGRDVTCDVVNGDATAGRNVNCGDVGGDVSAGGNVECGNVGGDIEADSYIERKNI